MRVSVLRGASVAGALRLAERGADRIDHRERVGKPRQIARGRPARDLGNDEVARRIDIDELAVDAACHRGADLEIADPPLPAIGLLRLAAAEGRIVKDSEIG